MKVSIGNATVVMDEIGSVQAETLEGGVWLKAEVSLSAVRGGNQGGVDGTVEIGCWEETDDDCVQWCAANEGARALAALAGIAPEDDTRGNFFRVVFADDCDALGRELCEEVRRAYRAKDECDAC